MRLITIVLLLMSMLLWLSYSNAKTPDKQGDVDIPAKSKNSKKGFAPAVIPRGQLLYEHHCQVCHSSTVHIRNKRRARNTDSIRSWVIHWSQYLGLSWGDSEVDEVVYYLNKRYYQFKK